MGLSQLSSFTFCIFEKIEIFIYSLNNFRGKQSRELGNKYLYNGLDANVLGFICTYNYCIPGYDINFAFADWPESQNEQLGRTTKMLNLHCLPINGVCVCVCVSRELVH